MAKVAVLNQAGKKVKDLELADSVFAVEPNNQVVFDVVYAQRAAMRQGTHSTKTRTEVRGGGKKPWRQKGTGRARQGSIRAPQWRGGGIAFGPKPRDYRVKVNQKVRQLALKIVLSDKLKENKLVVLDNLTFDKPRTKDFVTFLANIKVEGKVLVGVQAYNLAVDKSASNLPNVMVTSATHFSVYDILNAQTLVVTEEALKNLEVVLNG